MTIKQIAEAVGVSDVIVSRVLNGGLSRTVRVGESTRLRVLEQAERMGYRANFSARSMRRGRTNSVALLLPTVPDAAFLPKAFAERAAAALGERGQNLIMSVLTDAQLTSTDFMPRILRELSADGLLINYISSIPPRMIELIERHNIPSVWLNTKRDYDCVRPDDLAGGRQAVERLVGLGHRRIAFVRFGGEMHYSAAERQAGYEQAMRAAGLVPQLACYPWIPYSAHRDVSQDRRLADATALLGGADRPTAIVAYEMGEVLPLMFAAARLGLRIPQDLSMVVFHDFLVDHVGLAVTTLALRATPMSDAAVDMLMNKIESPHTAASPRLVPFEWVEGQSVAPPSAGA